MHTPERSHAVRKSTRTPEKAQALSAFRDLAAQLSGEIKEGKATERLEHAQTIEGIGRYSPLNQLLIVTQCPSVTEVHGYNEWRTLGYQVRKGEHGIRIIAPHQYNNTEGEEKTGFHSIVVFDKSQVDPLESLPTESADYSDEALLASGMPPEDL